MKNPCRALYEAGIFFRVSPASQDYEPRRPDFMDVAGGLPARTGGLGTFCCGTTFVLSGTA